VIYESKERTTTKRKGSGSLSNRHLFREMRCERGDAARQYGEPGKHECDVVNQVASPHSPHSPTRVYDVQSDRKKRANKILYKEKGGEGKERGDAHHKHYRSSSRPHHVSTMEFPASRSSCRIISDC
jgi:hypothetical protein